MIKATVVADSLSPQNHRLTSLLVTFPRIILSELNTHRILSKNSASSRAIPTKKMIKMVLENPFIPIAWQKEHKGMQGTEYLSNDLMEIRNQDTNAFQMAGRVDLAIAQHLSARDNAVEWATYQNEIGVTKQLCNRYLEPFMWHTVFISGTEWENFFELRCPQYQIGFDSTIYRSRKDLIKDYPLMVDNTEIEWLKYNKGQAEIHMMALAEAIWDAINESTPKQLQAGEWHIPFEDKIIPAKLLDNEIGIRNPLLTGGMWEEALIKVSTAMAARTSYTVVGDEKEVSYERLIGIHDKMAIAKPFHASPFEHAAPAMNDEEYHEYIKVFLHGKKGDRKFIRETEYGWCRNFRGFIQYRHIIESRNEIKSKEG